MQNNGCSLALDYHSNLPAYDSIAENPSCGDHRVPWSCARQAVLYGVCTTGIGHWGTDPYKPKIENKGQRDEYRVV